MTDDADGRNGIYIVIAVFVLAILVGVIFYFTSSKGKKAEGKIIVKTNEQQVAKKVSTEEGLTKMKNSLKDAEKGFLEMRPEEYDSMKIIKSFKDLRTAVDGKMINVSKFMLLPNNFEAAFEDKKLTMDEADLLIKMIENSIVVKEGNESK